MLTPEARCVGNARQLVVTALQATGVCSGDKATKSKPEDPLMCTGLSKKQPLGTAGLVGVGLMLREVKLPAQEHNPDPTDVRGDGQ